ncbi:hypothetical protein GCM10008018_17410 [Paenibacillus marchantiophytorum]|uniref:Dockerin domain-containing protein n=1 Tax=Paenibacillus marchantiophytorum TaxID=1619310 RepID=A0ABQ2BUI0_9BACL|nr:cohesin domain-containing protein [Paenibacillus marchantiophytorum]GGI46501.1 hypothetical protein GCM10008018_17410 [Paenibacillus marchantiophytorum]
MRKMGLIAFTVLFLLFNIISLPKSANAATASSIDISVVLHVGDSVQLSAGYPKVAWTVTELNGGVTDKAAVTTEGVVTAKKPGKVKVIATASDGTHYTGEILITIVGEVTTPAAVLNGAVNVAPGGSFDLIYGLRHVAGGIYAQDITLTFDPERLEFDSAVSLKENAISIVDTSKQPGKVRILAVSLGEDNANAASGDIIKLLWKVKSTAQAGTTTVSLSNVVVSNGSGGETTLNTENNSQIVIQAVSVNKQALLELISKAQGKHDNAVEGTLPSQYKAGSKAVLQSAINAAKAVADSASSSQQQVDAAETALTTALQTFADAVNPHIPGDQNGDAKVSIGDIAIIAAAYGKSSNDPDWEKVKNCDMNGDGKIDVVDLAAVASIMLKE